MTDSTTTLPGLITAWNNYVFVTYARLWLAAVSALAVTGCNAVLGNEDVLLNSAAGSQTDTDTAMDAPRAGDSGLSTGSPDSGGVGGRSRDPAAGGGSSASTSSAGAASGAAGVAGSTATGSAGQSGGTSAGQAGVGTGQPGGTPTTCAQLACPEHSSCDDAAAAPSCTCERGYELHTGVCLDVDECTNGSATCATQAACSNELGTFSCECRAPYIGDGQTCMLDDSCQQQHCDANARCTTRGCSCIAGYEGDGTQCTRRDPCLDNPCQHSGVCTTSATAYTCDCASTGFTGTNCAEPIDDCASKPCMNGGVCKDLVNDYMCTCAAGWSGKQCTTNQGCDYDGKHYNQGDSFDSTDGCNSCGCQASGQVVCTQRACVMSCGGRMGATCPSGQFCNYPASAQCGAADAGGTCQMIPATCGQQSSPVCGCDDKTYGNACTAARASVSVKKTGACVTGCEYMDTHHEPGDFPAGDGCNTCTCKNDGTVSCTKMTCDPTTCGGLTAIKCMNGKYCKFESGCGAGDATGTCTAKPDVCPDIVMPVCGCNGITYSNACGASRAGMSVQSPAACP